MTYRLTFWLCVVIPAATAIPSLAQNATEQPLTELREIWGREYGEAQQASGAADILRATFEGRYATYPDIGPQSSSEKARQDAEAVIAAYTKVITSYPYTEIAAYAAIRLAGFYQYLGQTAKAIDTAKDVATTYQYTLYGPKAAFETGLLYLQAADNPAAAVKWFQKVPAPTDSPIDSHEKYDEAANLYLAAQLHIARSAMTMGRRDIAREVFDRLGERYPMYRDTLARELGRLDRTVRHPTLQMVDEVIEERMAEIDKIPPIGPATGRLRSSVPTSADSTEKVDFSKEIAVTYPSQESRPFSYWVGWCLLVAGITMGVSGIRYRVRSRHKKGA